MIIFDGATYEKSSEKCPAAALTRSVLAGHRGFGFCSTIESKHHLVTFASFREPVSRIRSLYDYRLYKLNMFLRRNFSQQIVDFNATEEIEPGEARIRALCTQQTRFMYLFCLLLPLSQKNLKQLICQQFRCGYKCMGPSAYVLAKGLTLAQEEHLVLAIAKRNLYTLDSIGILDHLNDLIPQLRWQVGDLIPANFRSWPRENVVRGRTHLTTQAAAILREWSAMDVQLYDLAVQLAMRRRVEALTCLKLMRK